MASDFYGRSYLVRSEMLVSSLIDILWSEVKIIKILLSKKNF